MSNVKHQLIQYSDNSGFDNSVDPTTKLLFGSGENVVVCRDKNSLISLRSLQANAYQCPFCLKKLNTDLAIVSAANVNGVSKKSIDSAPTPHRQHSGTSPVLWGGIAGVVLLCLIVAVIGFAVLGGSGGTSIPPPINTRVGPKSTPVFSQPSLVNTPRKSPTPKPTKTSINNNSSYAKISCAEIYNVNLRRTPGYVGKNDNTDSLYEVPCGETVELLGPTKKVDGLTWWKVTWNGYTGWIADHTGSGKIILDFNP